MSLPVLTAVGDARAEAELSAALERDVPGIHVARRCVDVADLLAAAAAGLGRAVIVSADLRRLDRDALDRLSLAGVATVGWVAAGDEPGERRLRQLGVVQVVTAGAPITAVAEAVHVAVAEGVVSNPADRPAGSEQPEPDRDRFVPPLDLLDGTAGRPAGAVIAVWGPAGAPGRSTVAVNLSAELALAGRSTVLIDADTYGGAVGQLLGLLDEAPGLAAACRAANQGGLDRAVLGRLALTVRPGLSVLTGISRAERWPEIRSGALHQVLDLARTLADYVVVDCGFCLEQDEELAYDTAAPRRNGATLAALASADRIIAVTRSDPVGLARFVRALPECTAAAEVRPTTLVNRLRRGRRGSGDPRAEVSAALERYAGCSDLRFVPDDPDALDAALARGRLLSEAARNSPARTAIRDLAMTVAAAAVSG
ncbi:MAG TPA: P-loop NTPase [Mycobacteriales bacterium]|nr:P-loop NTPase [Mycobacteriales bacterium]